MGGWCCAMGGWADGQVSTWAKRFGSLRLVNWLFRFVSSSELAILFRFVSFRLVCFVLRGIGFASHAGLILPVGLLWWRVLQDSMMVGVYVSPSAMVLFLSFSS
jgi:hypothetical protein